jgi:hypothetical protein
MRIVTLSNSDVDLAVDVARGRSEPKDAIGVKSKLVSGRTSFGAMHDGVKAEIACARYFGVEIDLSFMLCGDQHKPDIYVNGFGCEVKAYRFSKPDMIIPSIDLIYHPDVFIVCKVDDSPSIALCGIVSPLKFWRHYERRDFGHGLHYFLNRSFFSPVDTLKRYKKAGQ